VRELMPTFFELLQQENERAVRVVLGHFTFVYIHPYLDGNGRMGRFMMNLMMASGGYSWTIIPLDRRAEYMAALVGKRESGHQTVRRIPGRPHEQEAIAGCAIRKRCSNRGPWQAQENRDGFAAFSMPSGNLYTSASSRPPTAW
jgi:hypothetical protein